MALGREEYTRECERRPLPDSPRAILVAHSFSVARSQATVPPPQNAVGPRLSGRRGCMLSREAGAPAPTLARRRVPAPEARARDGCAPRPTGENASVLLRAARRSLRIGPA